MVANHRATGSPASLGQGPALCCGSLPAPWWQVADAGVETRFRLESWANCRGSQVSSTSSLVRLEFLRPTYRRQLSQPLDIEFCFSKEEGRRKKKKKKEIPKYFPVKVKWWLWRTVPKSEIDQWIIDESISFWRVDWAHFEVLLTRARYGHCDSYYRTARLIRFQLPLWR